MACRFNEIDFACLLLFLMWKEMNCNAVDKMKELLNQAEIDVPTVLKVNSKALMSDTLGVDEPDNVLIGNPNVSKVKCTGCFSRMKLVAEVTVEELAKRRTCSVCGGKE
nr:hypothetical protein [Tanacetum cinerariifolium]